MNLLRNLSFLLIPVFLFSFDAINKKMPSVNLKTLDGKVINMDEFSNNGKITIVCFWATWCTPCKRELDTYGDLYEEWVEKYNVEVVAITIDNSRQLAKVKPLIAQKGWEFIVLSDVKKDLMNQLNFSYIPQTYVLDKTGNIVFDHSGFSPGDEYEIEDLLEKIK